MKGYIANGESVLESVLFAGFAGDELETIARALPENTDRFWGDKTAWYLAESKKIQDHLSSSGL